MSKNILISLTSIQVQDDERDETELMTRASFSRKDGCEIISYEDSETTGFDGCVTTITVKGCDSASVIRTGNVNSALYLEKNRKHYCQYDTPYGSMQIGVFTHAIENTISTDGRLYLRYTLDLNAAYLSDNEIIMKIQEQ